ncbi:hypothetical protein EJ110_NYTH29655 [Nymphaea thermarum]|nr:hypothetical protein EJ110_NYTH29655 [Nymphaea thermarum]
MTSGFTVSGLDFVPCHKVWTIGKAFHRSLAIKSMSKINVLEFRMLHHIVPRNGSRMLQFRNLTLAAVAVDVPQRSAEWFELRKNKLTTSSFSTALGFWKNRRSELWYEKVFEPDVSTFANTSAMTWGVLNEAAAIERYKSITGHEVGVLGFATHTNEEEFGWMGGSPDGLVTDVGILEVKCPYNNGKPELGVPWMKAPYYYLPQVQGLLEIMGREWVDLYCWTPKASTVFRVYKDISYWELIHGILKEFWWESVIPAREALLLGDTERAQKYMPTEKHHLTGYVMAKSRALAAESRIIYKEVEGKMELCDL